jgi:D-beta-D-heptose 7-phosphate kinase/D-beta-D-heptose 1-phosphate adenosyltransferase
MAIVKSIQVLRTFLSENSNQRPIYMTSGGFDPLHVGHVRCIVGTCDKASNKDIHPWQMMGLVVVVVNADSFLIRKKGYAFMPLEERMELINSIKGVDFVVPWETDGDQTVCGAINILKPKYFTKGGDRFDASTIPEWDICQKINCEIITGVGVGGKVQSSSELIARARAFEMEGVGYEFT